MADELTSRACPILAAHADQYLVVSRGEVMRIFDWNTKNSSAAKPSNTCRRLARDFIAQIGAARPLSEQFPKEMLLISERH